MFNFFILMKNYNTFMKWEVLKALYQGINLSVSNKNLIFRYWTFQSTCSLIFKVVSDLFVDIMIYRFDFLIVAMGEPDPCREPPPRISRY